jgi:hypothetical protein
MTFDFQCRSPSDLEHLGMKPMDLGAHEVFAVSLGVLMRCLDVSERRLGPAGEQAAISEVTRGLVVVSI